MNIKKNLPIPVAPGRGSLAQGFQLPVDRLADQLDAELRSLKARLDAGDIEGEPAAYQGSRTFNAETQSFAIGNVASAVDPATLVNYVLRDGQTYDIPIITPGPGVFVATSLAVSITQRRYDPTIAEAMDVNYESNWLGFNGGVNWTTKFCLWPSEPELTVDDTPYFMPSVMLNFMWNLLDGRTGNLYSDELMSHMLLKPRQLMADFGNRTVYPFSDGGLFQFPMPWVFPYGTNVVFKFRPITPVLQFDSTVTTPANGLDYDDRENGRRNQAITVKALLHGYRLMVAPGT